MSVLEHRRADAVGYGDTDAEQNGLPTQIFLQPIAAPSVLGLYAFAGSTLIVAAWMAGWYGTESTPDFLFPFAALFGGLAQFLAGMWAYRARDVLATAVHGTLGAFWMGYGLLWALFATGTLHPPNGQFPGLGFWFIVLAMVTSVTAFAALAESVGLFGVLSTFATGSVLAAVGYLMGSDNTVMVAGYFLVIAAVLAWYVASAMLLSTTFGRTILPLGRYSREANVPGGRPASIAQLAYGEPGVRRGQ
jgi:succinate-acetate transporter protein